MPSSRTGRPGEVTGLLHAARAGDRDAQDRLLGLLYRDLRDIAARQLRREAGNRTLQATALVHEAYVKLAAGGIVPAADRVHFLAMAARAMRQVLVDRARRRRSSKRGGDWIRTTLSGHAGPMELDPLDVLALDRALEELEPRQRQVVELRFFAGLEEVEVAEVLGVSDRTVRREWVKARARLYRRMYLHRDPGDGAGTDGSAAEREP
jgi:RNA polymerase sigma factor (TIGR02999 family)